MKKTLSLIIVTIAFLVFVTADVKECQRSMSPKDVPCYIISSWKPSGACSGYTVDFYNFSGAEIQTQTWGDYYPYCNATFNITDVGTYHYNSSVEEGVITLEGDDSEMILSITIFLLLINFVAFYLPFKVEFSRTSEAANYFVKRVVWIAAFLLLWFNTSLFRTLAVNWGLGIDEFLVVFWWIFTLGVFVCIFLIVYYGAIGGTKLMKEAKLKDRMGYDGE